MSHVVAPPSGWETRFVGVRERADVDEDRRIVGYPVVFNQRSLDLGGFFEVVKPSAVDRSLREGHDVRAYFNHDPAYVLGRTKSGTLTLKKDGHGLRARIHPPSTTLVKDLMTSIERGDISGMSFRFRTIEDAWHVEDGTPIRELLDIEIGEVSVVSEPAYAGTSVDVAQRSLQRFVDEQARSGRDTAWFERRLRVAGIR